MAQTSTPPPTGWGPTQPVLPGTIQKPQHQAHSPHSPPPLQEGAWAASPTSSGAMWGRGRGLGNSKGQERNPPRQLPLRPPAEGPSHGVCTPRPSEGHPFSHSCLPPTQALGGSVPGNPHTSTIYRALSPAQTMEQGSPAPWEPLRQSTRAAEHETQKRLARCGPSSSALAGGRNGHLVAQVAAAASGGSRSKTQCCN